jgi:prevent-host-death family protein
MIDVRDIRSLTEFKRNTSEVLEKLRETGRPAVLTVNGRAQVVVQDAEAYQKLLEVVDQAEAIQGIRRGLEEVRRGQTRPAKAALAKIRQKHRIPRA